MAMTIQQLIWLIGIHSIIHGIFGIIHITTSHYVNYNAALVHAFTVVHVILILLGVSVFCIVVFRRPMCARIFAGLLVILSISYLIVGMIYFVTYIPYFANSIVDALFYYSDIECWCGPDFPLTFWHALTFMLLLFILIWFLYAFLLCKMANCVCCIPCPPNPCLKPAAPRIPQYTTCPGPGGTTCYVRNKNWFNKLLKSKCTPMPPPPCCPPPSRPECPPPLCPLPPCPFPPYRYNTPPSVPCPVFTVPQPPPCIPPPPPCEPKKSQRFALSLRHGRFCR